MRYPDELTLRRATGEDAYGNPASSWDEPTLIPTRAFITGGQAYLPADTDIQHGDRFTFRGRVWEVDGRPNLLRSPSRDVLIIATLKRIADAKGTPIPDAEPEGGVS